MDDKPCVKANCPAYSADDGQCRALAWPKATAPESSERLKATAPESSERAACLEDLLFQRPCQFSLYILRMAGCFINKRGLRTQFEPWEIHNDVVGDLMKAGLRNLTPTYEDFRNFVTIVTRNAVNRRYRQIHGDYQQGAIKFDDLDEIDRCEPSANQPTMPDDLGVEEALRKMESLGPRQRYQAQLIRFTLEGYTVTEIAKLVKKNRSAVAHELHGTRETADDGAGHHIDYHQAGAYDLFRAIYTGADFELKKLESKEKRPWLWPVVDRRDFSADDRRPAFNHIGHELGATTLQAVERYKDGWQWINTLGAKGGWTMTDGKDNHGEEQPRQAPPRRRIAKASEMRHPAFQALLSYAEDALDREARKRIAAHVLICHSCLAELEHIETEVLPEMNRPVSLWERLRWQAARLAGRLRETSKIMNDSGGIRTSARGAWFVNIWSMFARSPYRVAEIAIVVVVMLLSSLWWGARHRELDKQLTVLTVTVDALKQQNESLQQENARLQSEVKEATTFKGDYDRAIADFSKVIASNPSDAKAYSNRGIAYASKGDYDRAIADFSKAIALQRATQPHVLVTLQDASGVVTIGRDSTVRLPGKTTLPPAISRSVHEFVTTGMAMLAEPVSTAMEKLRGDETRGALRSARGATAVKPIPRSPVLTATKSTRPALRWEPVPEAQEYKIVVADRDNKIVWEGSAGTQTRLTLPLGILQLGQSYFWQVEAIVEGQSRLSPPVGFWVLDEKMLQEVAAAERGYRDSALVLASLYATYGLYEEALTQVERLTKMNPTNPFAQAMLHNLRRQLGKE